MLTDAEASGPEGQALCETSFLTSIPGSLESGGLAIYSLEILVGTRT